ncbi:uncharacterized protein LOC108732791 [Agrilus planipennis]|uniref:Uncharacterized protein LOC108732791 n=1 Tax=Agrilus planipennis TaxID=224129 RepID=A0A1W4WFL8_AGRPL|nr:uncharacterized protein LOC108732791 [Agrilus planipennis]
MNSTDDFLYLQMLLSNVIKDVGPLIDLKFRGGKEIELFSISNSVKEYLSLKTYIKSSHIEYKFQQNVNNIVLCLIVNTDFEDSSFKNQESVVHLLNSIPPLSKCVLISILVEVELSECLPKIHSLLSPKVILEMVDEFIVFSKRALPQKSLPPAVNFLKTIILVFSLIDDNFQNKEILERLTDAGVEVARGVGRVNPDLIEGWTSKRVYSHMGYTLINLLRLLLVCNEESNLLSKLINGLISASIFIMNAVSVDVFCIWAEITFEGHPLQTVIAFEAYNVVNKYNSYGPAKKLVHMLSTISRKPKSLREIILESDVESIVDRVGDTDSEPDIQRQWFVALLNTDVFSNKKATKCLKQYTHLCNDEDVFRILNLSRNYTSKEVKQVALNCAKNLEPSKLNIIITRFFYEYGVNSDLCIVDNIEESLKKVLGRIKDEQDESSIANDILILILQSPEETLEVLFMERLYNVEYANKLRDTFRYIKCVAEVNSIWFKTFSKMFSVTRETLPNYTNFVNTLIELEYISFAKYSEDFLAPKIDDLVSKTDYENLLTILYLLHGIEHIDGKSCKFLTTVLNALNKTRCKFLEFSCVKQNCAKLIVEVLNRIIFSGKVTNDEIQVENLDKINRFYLDCIKIRRDFLTYIFPNVESLEYSEWISRLIQLLPQGVEIEWEDSFKTVKSIKGLDKAAEMFTDVLLLLCQLVDSQTDKESEQARNSSAGLKYYLELYSTTIKKYLFCDNSIEMGKVGCKNVCRLLKYIPDDIKEEEGLKLIETLPEDALKKLTNDESFVYSLAAIDNRKLSQIIAKRMIS